MRAGTDTRIVSIMPIEKIVATFRAWRGVIRNFIGWEPRIAKTFLCCFIHVGGLIFAQLCQLALLQ